MSSPATPPSPGPAAGPRRSFRLGDGVGRGLAVAAAAGVFLAYTGWLRRPALSAARPAGRRPAFV